MKTFIFMIAMLVSIGSYSASVNSGGNLTGVTFNNGEVKQDALWPGTTYHDATISSSTEPVGTAITAALYKVVRVCAQTKGVHILFSADGAAADGDDYLVLADTCGDFVVDPAANRLAVIQESATAEVYVTLLK